MNQTTLTYENLIERFVQWAQNCPDIRAAAVIGSRARIDKPADEWADLDIVVIVTNPKRYLAREDWLQNIGNPWITFLERTATGGGMERRALFEGGLDVDFAIVSKRDIRQLMHFLRINKRFPQLLRLFPKEKVRQIIREITDFSDIISHGIRVLLDKDGLISQSTLFSTRPPSPRPPTPAEFLEVINDFWYHAVWTAKHLRRGELWWAKGSCDSKMKWGGVLPMIEWHARATHGRDYETWHRGHFLEQWADHRAVEGLRKAFAHYDVDDVQQALLATMDLFRWLARETAERLGYVYPTFADERATEMVKTLLSEKIQPISYPTYKKP